MGTKRFRPTVVLITALLIGIFSIDTHAVTLDVYNDINISNYSGTGEKLANALIKEGSGINILAGSSQFQGNFDNSPIFLIEGDSGCGVECGDDGELDKYGSASFFSDLNLGSTGSTNFVLPDGILLSWGVFWVAGELQKENEINICFSCYI